jgi:hypothetical protein
MSMQPVLHSYGYCLDFLREQVADVVDEDMATQPSGIANHPAWVIGHLTNGCELLAGVIGVPRWLPEDWASRFGQGSLPVADRMRYPKKEELLARLGDAQDRITRAIKGLSDDQLDAPFPIEKYRRVFPTIRHALTQILVGHTGYHVGEITVWRRAMGMAQMGRGFQ